MQDHAEDTLRDCIRLRWLAVCCGWSTVPLCDTAMPTQCEGEKESVVISGGKHDLWLVYFLRLDYFIIVGVLKNWKVERVSLLFVQYVFNSGSIRSP